VIFFSGWPKILKQKSLSSPLDFSFLVSGNSETQNSREKKKNTVKTQRSIFVFWPIEASKYRC